MAGNKRSGGKFKPTSLHLVEGTLRKPRNNEPKPELVLLECPEFLHGYAREKWDYLAPRLYRLGLLTEFDGDALAAYCKAYHRWRKAEESVDEFEKADPRFHGLVIRTVNKGEKGGGNTIQNPLVGIANTAMREMNKIAIEFGLTPSARARISVDNAQTASLDPASKYFQSA